MNRPVVICSVLESTTSATLQAIADAPRGCELVELRADRLPLSEISVVVQRVERPLLVSIRRREDGGAFVGSEGERRRGLLAALQAGARLIDVEWNSPLRELASGEFASQVVLSHHGAACRSDALEPILREMAETRAARLKIVPTARRPGEGAAVRELLAGSDGRLACFAQGRAGAITRVLAPSWGSWAVYGAQRVGAETAEGQFPVADLLDVHEVGGVAPETLRFGLVGRHVFGSPSPAMHRAGYREAGIDARLIPIELDAFEELEPLAAADGFVGLSGLAVTLPFKEVAARRCTASDPIAAASGAVNTVKLEADGWSGYNTDGPAALDLIAAHVDPAGARVAVHGAGGTARAVAAALGRAGAEVTLFNRTFERALNAAGCVGANARPLAELRGFGWDVLVQATPAGGRGEEVVPAESLTGRLVLDAVYGAPTPLTAAASARGLVVVDGFALLVAQAVHQFRLLTGRSASGGALSAAGRGWLAARAAAST